MQTFTVTAERGAHGRWVLECPELGAVSQTKRLDQVEEEMREPIAYLADIDQDDVRIEVVPVISEDIQAQKERAEELRRVADEAQQTSALAQRELAQMLKERGFTVRDMGTILGVSYQRAAKLAKAS